MIKLLKSKRKIVYVILAIILVLSTWYGLKEKGITATASDSEIVSCSEFAEGEEVITEETEIEDVEVASNSDELLEATALETIEETATDEEVSEDAIATVAEDGTITTEEYSDDGIMLAAGGFNPGGQSGNELDASSYNSSALVYWDTMTATTTTGWGGTTTTYSGTGTGAGVKEVTLGTSSTSQTTVKQANSNNTSWSGGTALSKYFPNAKKSNSSSDDSTMEEGILTITPAEGYYVTKVVVACCASGTPYQCNTWSQGNAFTENFTYTASGTIQINISSLDFSHTSSDDSYFILIQVAPIPSPLYVEYSYGDILSLMGVDTSSYSGYFSTADSWTDTTSGNVYHGEDDTGATGGVQTDDTQYKYDYSVTTGMTDAQKAAEAAKWKHYANTVTDEAKQEAWESGYYFAGWKAYYYTTVTVTNPDGTKEYVYANNYEYDFDEDTFYGTTDYAEGASVTLTTNVLLVAQWTQIETTSITKVWADTGYESNRPDSITANLVGTVTSSDGTETVVVNGVLGVTSADGLVLTSDNSWTQSDIKAPSYYWDGTTIDYELSENSVTGYVTTITGSRAEGYTITNTYVPSTAITIKKLDSDDNSALEGVSFTLSNGETPLYFAYDSGIYQLDSSSASTSTTTLITNSEGLIVINGLTTGTYTLTETSTLTGYSSTNLPSMTITVYEGSDGVLQVSVSGTDGTYKVDEDGTLIVYNTPLYSTLTISKVNIAGTGLAGVRFTIQEIDKNGTLVGDPTEVTTGEDGTISFSSRYGKRYIITEVETLDGYYLLDSPIYVEVNDSGNWSLYTIDEEGNWVSYNQSEDDETYENVSLSNTTLTVINQAHSELPKAGGIGTHGFYILGIAIMTLCLGIRIYLKKSKKF